MAFRKHPGLGTPIDAEPWERYGTARENRAGADRHDGGGFRRERVPYPGPDEGSSRKRRATRPFSRAGTQRIPAEGLPRAGRVRRPVPGSARGAVHRRGVQSRFRAGRVPRATPRGGGRPVQRSGAAPAGQRRGDHPQVPSAHLRRLRRRPLLRPGAGAGAAAGGGRDAPGRLHLRGPLERQAVLEAAPVSARSDRGTGREGRRAARQRLRVALCDGQTRGPAQDGQRDRAPPWAADRHVQPGRRERLAGLRRPIAAGARERRAPAGSGRVPGGLDRRGARARHGPADAPGRSHPGRLRDPGPDPGDQRRGARGRGGVRSRLVG